MGYYYLKIKELVWRFTNYHYSWSICAAVASLSSLVFWLYYIGSIFIVIGMVFSLIGMKYSNKELAIKAFFVGLGVFLLQIVIMCYKHQVLRFVVWFHIIAIFITLYVLITSLLNIDFSLRSKDYGMKNAYSFVAFFSMIALLIQYFMTPMMFLIQS